ncbi:MAG TPA: MgtC/SapB family protein [Bryobacteraceae bacterium]|nr:MgtC/SapB family protein [Bryobacteraceae bacterium]
MFTPPDFSLKLAVSVGIGMLVGLEREWSQKDLGARTFAITAMLGTLSMLAGPGLAYTSFAGLLAITELTAVRNIREGRAVEATTFVAVNRTFSECLSAKTITTLPSLLPL